MSNAPEVRADRDHAVEPERFIAITDVPALAWMPRRRGHKKIDARNVRRWATRGVGGVVLRTVFVGGMKCTTEGWLREFISARSSGPHHAVPAPIPEPAQAQHARAVAKLQAEGL